MLTDDEKHEIAEEFPNYANKRSVSIDALKIVQRHRGWVSDESLQDVAEFLELSPSDLESVATFYNLIFRQPVGRHVIMVCNSITCWVMGYESVHDALRKRLSIDFGGTTSDGRFTMLPIVCLGICDHAPAMMIDDDTFTDLDDGKLDAILARYS